MNVVEALKEVLVDVLVAVLGFILISAGNVGHKGLTCGTERVEAAAQAK